MKSYQLNNFDLNPSDRKYNYNKDLSNLSINYTPSKINNEYPINTQSKTLYTTNKIKLNENNMGQRSFSTNSSFNTTTPNNYFYISNNTNYDSHIPSIESLEKKLIDFKEKLRKDNFESYNDLKYPNNDMINYTQGNNFSSRNVTYITNNFNSPIDSNQYRDKLTSLEKEKEYLMLKNMELENEIKKLDIMLNNNNRKYINPIIQQNFGQNFNINFEKGDDNQKLQNLQNLPLNSQNLKMKKHLKDLDKKIISLKNQVRNAQSISFANNDNNIQSTTYLEIQIWKQRCIQLADNYINTLHNLKKELENDKNGFKNAIQKIRKNFTKNINDMYNHYNITILKNEKNIKILEKENSDLREKEKKIREVYMYNFS
jgi:hypothetical protein